MCKILSVTNCDNLDLKDGKFLNLVKNVVTIRDNHGFGWAGIDKTGQLFGERTIDITGFQPFAKAFKRLPIVDEVKNQFGNIKSKPVSLIAHGRLSTNSISLDNTHPFISDKTALIHNGVVDDYTGLMLDHCKTDNDSEILLRYWDTAGIKAIESNVTGYYAMAVLDSRGLHVIRDSKASLYITYCKEVKSYIIATTKDILFMLFKGMKWDIGSIDKISDNTYALFQKNNIIEHKKIEPLDHELSYTQQSLVRQSLGYKDEEKDFINIQELKKIS